MVNGKMEQMINRKAKSYLIASMVIFGTIGLFVRLIGMPSAVIAMLRGYIGFFCLILALRVSRRKYDREAIRRNLFFLLVSGAFIGINWILLFEAYRYTTVAVATLCYYMQPVFVTLASAMVLGERLTMRKAVCVLAALFGMTFVSGIWQESSGEGLRLTGIMLGVGAAFFYACVILLNKKMQEIDPIQQTSVQLLAAAVTVTPYVCLTVKAGELALTAKGLLLILVVGIFHTGFAYVLYFGQIQKLPAQTVAILSYIDPVVAIILSALLLHEPLGITGVIGAILILGAAFVSESGT